MATEHSHRDQDENIPPGWSYNPSSWPQRLPIVGLALVGTAIGPAMDEFLASLQCMRRERDRGCSLWRAFWGRGERPPEAA